MASLAAQLDSSNRRIDLHCHSMASANDMERVLRFKESVNSPDDVYIRAKRRGMDFVTITDKDSITVGLQMARRHDFILGEELTCRFLEDRTNVRVLIWGINRSDHEALQAISRNIYTVAEYLARQRIAHAVVQPTTERHSRLSRWHVERLMILFKGFEMINSSMDAMHDDPFAPVLKTLDAEELSRIAVRHGLKPLWPQSHVKSLTGGSNDHGLTRVGRIWTEFPNHARTIPDILECLRIGMCRPGSLTPEQINAADSMLEIAMESM